MSALSAQIDHFAPSRREGETEDAALDPSFARAVDAVFTLDETHHQRLDISVSNAPYEALIEASQKLRSFGLSSELANETIEAMEEQLVHLGVDFTKKEKPTPLKLFFGIVDEKPELDKDKVNFMVAWDRNRKYGASYSSIGMSFVNRGGKNTKITQTNVPDLENMFTGGSKYLVFWCEKLEGDGVGGLDEKGVQLASVIEALGPATAASAGGEAIAKSIERGNISPKVLEIVQSVAAIKHAASSAKFEGVPERAAPAIVEIKRDIPAQIMQAAMAEPLPPVIVKAVNQAMDMAAPAAIKAEPARVNTNNFVRPETAAPVMAKNDNISVVATAPKPIEIVRAMADTPRSAQPAAPQAAAPQAARPAAQQSVPQAPVKTAPVMAAPSVQQSAPVRTAPVQQQPARPQTQPVQVHAQPQATQAKPVVQIQNQAPAQPQAQAVKPQPAPQATQQQAAPAQKPQQTQTAPQKPVQQQVQAQPQAPKAVETIIYAAKQPEKFTQELKRFENISPEVKAFIAAPTPAPMTQERADKIAAELPPQDRQEFFRTMNDHTEMRIERQTPPPVQGDDYRWKPDPVETISWPKHAPEIISFDSKSHPPVITPRGNRENVWNVTETKIPSFDLISKSGSGTTQSFSRCAGCSGGAACASCGASFNAASARSDKDTAYKAAHSGVSLKFS